MVTRNQKDGEPANAVESRMWVKPPGFFLVDAWERMEVRMENLPVGDGTGRKAEPMIWTRIPWF